MEPESSRVSRRTVLAAAGVPLGVGLLAACGEDEPTAPTAEGSTGEASSESPDGSGEESPAAGGAALAAVADIPVGGALVVEEGPDGTPVVLSRPSEDEVVAFSAICTHKGCTVKADQSQIVCPCHGSTFDFAGQNTGGPAPEPLTKVDVSVEGGDVVPA